MTDAQEVISDYFLGTELRGGSARETFLLYAFLYHLDSF